MSTEIQVEKVIRDGKVAVLYSPGYGAGWSSWCRGDVPEEFAIFDKSLVEAVERGDDAGKVGLMLTEKFGSAPYMGGWSDVEIEWLPVGTQFRIDEYDGSESVVTVEKLSFTA